MKLNVVQYGEANNKYQCPIVILHGLFGSHRNWTPIAKHLAKKQRVYSLDLRNHGQSPHTELMDYPSMAQDVLQFIEKLIVKNEYHSVNIIAHSMGGKAALYLALTQAELINKLVIVDIAPLPYQHEFDEVLKGFKSVPLEKIKSRREADECLSHTIQDEGLRQFLLQNLQQTPTDKKPGEYQWRLNLDAISRSIPFISGFPDTRQMKPYPKKVLFVGGGESDYLSKANQALSKELFPLASFSMIKSAGHWLHAEQPEIFLALIEPYMSL